MGDGLDIYYTNQWAKTPVNFPLATGKIADYSFYLISHVITQNHLSITLLFTIHYRTLYLYHYNDIIVVFIFK